MIIRSKAAMGIVSFFATVSATAALADFGFPETCEGSDANSANAEDNCKTSCSDLALMCEWAGGDATVNVGKCDNLNNCWEESDIWYCRISFDCSF